MPLDVQALLRRLALAEFERDEYRGALTQIKRSPKSAKLIAQQHLDGCGSVAREIERVIERAEKIKAELEV